MTEKDQKMIDSFDKILDCYRELYQLCEKVGCQDCEVYETCGILCRGYAPIAILNWCQERRKDQICHRKNVYGPRIKWRKED